MNVRRTPSFVSPKGQAGADPAEPPDLLSAVLRELRFESAAYRWLEFGGPFGIGFDLPGLRGVHIIVRGECEVVYEDGCVDRLTAGDLVIHPRGDPHVLRSTAAGTGTVSISELARRMTGTRLQAIGPPADTVIVCGAFHIHEPDHPALRGLPRSIHLPGDAGHPPPGLGPLVDALSAEAFDGGPGSDLVMARLSDALLVRALRLYSDRVDQPGWLAGLADPYVAVALSAIHADLARPWTLVGLAATVGLSRAAFAARFTDRVGEPAMHYLLSLRMQRAKVLLRNEQTTIAAVAAQVGYQSDVAFAAAFKREIGSPPGAYRRSSSRR